jgi:23S rRNA pseudouridine2605 synthase
VLAHAGVSSRRACEELILQGRVTVDGQVVRELGTRVDPRRQQVAVDGQKVQAERNVYYAVHKPKGYVSTNLDPAGKPRVVDLLPVIPQRVYAVGRLDEQSTGLILLTNDGELANRLAHPRFGVEKVYRVVVAGDPGREVLDQLTQGVWLAEGKVRAKRVRVTGHKGQATVLEMVLGEGKNREIRRMLARLGHKVMSLTRIAVGPIGLKGLGVGECRPLTAFEIDLLRKVAAGLVVPTPRFPDRRDRIPRPGGAPGKPTRPPAHDAARPSAEARHDRPAPRRPAPAPGHPEHPAPVRGRGPGPSRRPVSGPGTGPPPPHARGPARRPSRPGPPAADRPLTRPKATTSRREDLPPRRIIGLEPQPGARRAGPTGPRPLRRRPGPKRSPRSALGVKRPAKPDEGDGQ